MTADTNHSSTPNLRIAHLITSLGTLSKAFSKSTKPKFLQHSWLCVCVCRFPAAFIHYIPPGVSDKLVCMCTFDQIIAEGVFQGGSVEKLIVFDLLPEPQPDGWGNFVNVNLSDLVIFADQKPNFFEPLIFANQPPPSYSEVANARMAPPPPTPPSPHIIQTEERRFARSAIPPPSIKSEIDRPVEYFPPLIEPTVHCSPVTRSFVPPPPPPPQSTRTMPPPIESPDPPHPGVTHFMDPVNIPLNPVHNEEEEMYDVFLAVFEPPLTITIL